jgi:2,3-bisphosphoglycerate-independent phosphoglycerate mutase
MAKRNGLTQVYVHAFLDGRDTPPTSGLGYINQLEAYMNDLGVGQIATISGRYYAMDRDTRWERVKLAYDALTTGVGKYASDAVTCMEKTYADGVNDEFVVPTIITQDGKPVTTIKEKDSVIFFNFRPDRAREISRVFCDPGFAEFERTYFPLYYACFTEYDVTIPNKHVAFLAQSMDNVLGQYLADQGMTQLRLAETEKYAHVTFFFNGGNEKPYAGEDRILVPSPKVATYDLQPEMSASEVTDKLVEAIESEKYDLIVVNYANPDMVGHTGILPAAIKALETVDTCVARAVEAMMKTGTRMFLCADHGNSDKMIDHVTGEPFTAHSTNPVPFVLFNCGNARLKPGGRLADISPTLLDLMGLPKPPEMTGESLLVKDI